ncbi:unnamed protein product [Didymodactylos carnosus]|uniref:Uncharacterized protein n=1 Tax=Didymodactylos carnosus TaxID=1234261 RepID=A0A815AFB6_9BILA|nr:unnamed protein product [Didymodactylos carnosus]CAF4027056.1 unnamed protein product [Didymodactylos carnosus]
MDNEGLVEEENHIIKQIVITTDNLTTMNDQNKFSVNFFILPASSAKVDDIVRANLWNIQKTEVKPDGTIQDLINSINNQQKTKQVFYPIVMLNERVLSAHAKLSSYSNELSRSTVYLFIKDDINNETSTSEQTGHKQLSRNRIVRNRVTDSGITNTTHSENPASELKILLTNTYQPFAYYKNAESADTLSNVFIHFIPQKRKVSTESDSPSSDTAPGANKSAEKKILHLEDIPINERFSEIKTKTVRMLNLNNYNYEDYELFYHGRLLNSNSTFKKMDIHTSCILTFVQKSFCRVLVLDKINTPMTTDSSQEKLSHAAFIYSLRLLIYAIIFDSKYDKNFQRFFTYCDYNKSLTLGKRELEIGLLTLLKLINSGKLCDNENDNEDEYVGENPETDRLAYYDLLSTPSDQEWKLPEFKCFFADILVEHIYICSLSLLYHSNYTQNNSYYQVNVLEAYWPFILLIYFIVYFSVIYATGFIRQTKLNKTLLKRTYDKAKLKILNEYTKPVKYQINKPVNKEYYPPHLELTYYKFELCRHFTDHKILFSFSIIIFLVIILIHPCIPYIYRHINLNSTITSQRPCLLTYANLFGSLKRLMSQTNSEKHRELDLYIYFNLTNPHNLEYFLYLLKTSQSSVDETNISIATIGFALIIDAILIIESIVRVILFNEYDLLTIFSLIDIVILSVLILLFLTIVVRISDQSFKMFTRKKLKKDDMTALLVHRNGLNSLKYKSNVTTTTDTSFQQPEHTDDNEMIIAQNLKANNAYLLSVIEHLESSKDDYAVKILSVVIDQAFLIKILISMLTGIISTITSLTKR